MISSLPNSTSQSSTTDGSTEKVNEIKTSTTSVQDNNKNNRVSQIPTSIQSKPNIPSTTKTQPTSNTQEITNLENEIRTFLSNKQKFRFSSNTKNIIVQLYKSTHRPTTNKEIIGKKVPPIEPVYESIPEYNRMIQKLNQIDNEVTDSLNTVSSKPALYNISYPDELYPYIIDKSYENTVQLKEGEPIYKLDPADKSRYDDLMAKLRMLKIKGIHKGGKRKTRKQRVRNTENKRRSNKRGSTTQKRVRKMHE